MKLWPEQEREKSVDPFREVWESILKQTKGNPFIHNSLERANKLCLSLLEPKGPLDYYLKLKEPAEWQIFYTYLLERFVRTDEELDEVLWKNTVKVIDPVRNELLKKLTLPVVNANEWLKKADNAAQMIVAVQRNRDIDPERKPGRIAGLAQRFNRELNEIRSQNNENP